MTLQELLEINRRRLINAEKCTISEPPVKLPKYDWNCMKFYTELWEPD